MGTNTGILGDEAIGKVNFSLLLLSTQGDCFFAAFVVCLGFCFIYE